MYALVLIVGEASAACEREVEVTNVGAEPRERLQYQVSAPTMGPARSWWRDIEGNQANGRPVSDFGPIGEDVEFDVEVAPTSDGFSVDWTLRDYEYGRSKRDHDDVFVEAGGLTGRIEYDRSGGELRRTNTVAPSTRWLKRADARAGNFVHALPEQEVGAGATWRVVRRCSGYTWTEDVTFHGRKGSRVYLSGQVSSIDHPNGKEVELDERTRLVKLAGGFWREWRVEIDLQTIATASFVAQDGWIDNSYVRSDGDKGQFLARVSWYSTEQFDPRPSVEMPGNASGD